MSTAPIATQYTYEFIQRYLPAKTVSILEVGCGLGEVAARLIIDGAQVVGIDSDEGCVANARGLGVDARCETWPAPMERMFDAVLFTRSLHHITPLDDAIAAAVAVLRPGGKIIVEDFRVEAVSHRTNTWFNGLVTLLDAADLLRGSVDVLLDKLDFGESRQHLHSSESMKRDLDRHGTVENEDAAYYFRYAEPMLEQQISAVLLDYEISLIKSGAIDALGKRFVLAPN